MKKLITCIIACMSLTAQAADTLTIRQVFKEMPDTIIPYLSHNNRLDLLDFMDSQMKAEVTNAFGGRSVMTTLTNDSLTLQLNEICKVELLLLTTTDVVDSSTKVIALRRTLGKEKGYQECDVEYYSVKWKRLKTNVTAL